MLTIYATHFWVIPLWSIAVQKDKGIFCHSRCTESIWLTLAALWKFRGFPFVGLIYENSRLFYFNGWDSHWLIFHCIKCRCRNQLLLYLMILVQVQTNTLNSSFNPLLCFYLSVHSFAHSIVYFPQNFTFKVLRGRERLMLKVSHAGNSGLTNPLL